MRLTKSEQEMMAVFWDAGKPLSQPELLAQAGQKSWKDSSVYILINNLLKKGVLREEGFVRSGKAYARTFAPAMTYEEYCACEIRSLARKASLPKLFSALMADSNISEQTIQELQKLLEQAEKEAQAHD